MRPALPGQKGNVSSTVAEHDSLKREMEEMIVPQATVIGPPSLPSSLLSLVCTAAREFQVS
jgi:hypothetical protein